MIRSLRESKATLSELVERASRGEDVLITVRGKVKARLTRAAPPTGAAEMQRWADELRDLHRGIATETHRLPSETVLGEDREDW